MLHEARVIAAQPRHYRDFVRFHAELGVDDRAPDEAAWLASLAPDSFFLELDGQIAAYGWGQVLAESGYVRHVVVAPAFRGRRLGHAVMHEHARRFRAGGCKLWRLNVLAENTVAIGLYRALGMQREYATSVVRIAPRRIAELPAPPNAVRIRDAAPDEDARIEQRFELPTGLLAKYRTRPAQHFIVVELDGELAAFARFDPSVPGAMPFVAPDPTLARPLLEALAANLPDGAPWVQVVIERNERTARTLLDAGATLAHSIEHMSGTLPAA